MMGFLLTGLASLGAASAAPSKGSLPIVFIPNHGQTSSPAQFMVRGSGVTAYFAQREAVVQGHGGSVRMEFVDVTGPQSIEGTGRLPGAANFLFGTEETWRLDVPMFSGLAYRALYPGIDMVYRGAGSNLKSEFIVSPGADPARIRLRYTGADRVRVEEDGSLTIRFGRIVLRDDTPLLYQERDGTQVRVEGSFAVSGDVVGFLVGSYDRTLPLIIDPVLYSTLLGGSGADSATSLAVDSTGAAYVAGFTSSYDFPSKGPAQNLNAGGNDVFVAKLNPAGNGLVYCTYIGGRSDDRAYGIAVDSSGAAYVAGSTTSSDFPVRSALQPRLGGGKNAFVLKLNPAGNALVFSTFLGGSGIDAANGIALDTAGNAYIAGDTTSANFPAAAFQRSNRGGQDAFVAKLAADGSGLLYSTYLGGSNQDHAAAIAVDAAGEVFVTGSTYSLDFPAANAFQATLAGGQDAFVTKLAADGQSLVFSTYLGGTGGRLGSPEEGEGIAVDTQGSVYIAGVTGSVDFPISGAAQTTNAGWQDAFAAKLTPSGALIYSTYLGGPNIDKANAIAVDAAGNAYIAGETTSANFAFLPASQNSVAGGYDAFVVKLLPSGSAVAAVTYLGGTGADTATAIVVDSAANIYIAGWTQSPDFPVANGFQTINGGNYSAFVGKPNFGGPAPNQPVLVVAKSHTGNFIQGQNGAAYNVTVSNAAGAGPTTGTVTITEATPAGMALVSMAGAGWTCASGLNTCTCSDVLAGGSSYPAITVTVNVSSSALPQITNQVSASGGGSVIVNAADPTNIDSAAPTVVSLTPSSGSGLSQTFSAAFANPGGAAAFTSAYMLINGGFDAQSSCYLLYLRIGNGLFLLNDSASGWLGPVTPGAAATLQNSQCTLNASGSSVTASGNTLTLNAALTFMPAFAGAKTVFLFAYTASAGTGYQTAGTWAVTAGGPPTAGPLTPASGSGASQTFSAAFANPGGAAAFTSAYMLINAGFDAQSSCYLYYLRSANGLYLLNDSASGWLGPVTPGAAVTLQNSQCTLNASGSSATVLGNTLTLNAALTFMPAFAGAKTVFLFAYTASAGTGYQTAGTWTVTAGGPPTAGPLTPASGSGASQTFSAAFANPGGAAAFTSAYMLINAGFDAQSSCYLYYLRSANGLYLLNDSASGWLGPVTPGAAVTLQNSQCTLNASGSSVTLSGNTLTLNAALTFKPAFAGSKTVFLFAYTATATTGYQNAGSWTSK